MVLSITTVPVTTVIGEQFDYNLRMDLLELPDPLELATVPVHGDVQTKFRNAHFQGLSDPADVIDVHKN